MTHNTPDKQGEALELFRRSVGFQFGFVMYSGLDVKTAVDHICAAAEVLFAARRASVAAVEGDAALVEQIVEAVWHNVKRYEDGEIWMDTLKAKAQVKKLLTTAIASSSAPAEPPPTCGPARPDDGSECAYSVCPRPRDGCSEYCWQHHRSQCATNIQSKEQENA